MWSPNAKHWKNKIFMVGLVYEGFMKEVDLMMTENWVPDRFHLLDCPVLIGYIHS